MDLAAILALIGPATQMILGIEALIAQAQGVNSSTSLDDVNAALAALKAADESLYATVQAKLQAAAAS